MMKVLKYKYQVFQNFNNVALNNNKLFKYTNLSSNLLKYFPALQDMYVTLKLIPQYLRVSS